MLLILLPLLLLVVGIIFIIKNHNKFATFSILLIILLFNTFLISLVEHIVFKYLSINNILIMILLVVCNSLTFILKDLTIFNGSKNDKDVFVITKNILLYELISIAGIIGLIIYLAL